LLRWMLRMLRGLLRGRLLRGMLRWRHRLPAWFSCCRRHDMLWILSSCIIAFLSAAVGLLFVVADMALMAPGGFVAAIAWSFAAARELTR
jgi:hypothetical protein